ncbi:MAG TPA: hypothetical protein VGF55_34105, partial [Gemmataceae bacterium]
MTAYPYRIRLRGPWEAESLDPSGNAVARRVHLPARLGECGLGEARQVRLRRRFGRPRTLDAYERVWLVGEGLTGRAEFRLNGHILGTPPGDTGPFAFPVTGFLAERNELVVELSPDGPDGGLWGDVALEVRCAAYLTGVRAEPAGAALRITGAVAGEADGSLEVYVLAAGRTVGYGTCPAGQTFDVVTDELSERPPDVRVELVNGAVVWYAVDVAV